MKVIMYHYIREYNNDFPYFRFLDIQNFRKQLDYFEANFGFVTRENWEKVVTKKDLFENEGKIVLTFDDALSCHFDFVFPELTKRNLWGIFYIPTKPYINQEILDVHKIHLLCGSFEGKLLIKMLYDCLEDEMISNHKKDNFAKFTYTTQVNYSGVTEFKRILNYFVDVKFRKILIEKIASKVNFKFNSKNFYIPKKSLKKMFSYGNIIGAHSVTHPVMSTLTISEQREEIRGSFNFLINHGFNNHKTYCHPYGGSYSFNKKTIEILQKEEVFYSFNVESRDILQIDLSTSAQCLPRYNCNEYPYGTAS